MNVVFELNYSNFHVNKYLSYHKSRWTSAHLLIGTLNVIATINLLISLARNIFFLNI